jgi:hypothetical protein
MVPKGPGRRCPVDITQQDRHEVANDLASKPVGQLDPATPLLVLRGYCPLCSAEVNSFRDEGSLREYRISGMCQSCQDKFFGIDGEGPMETSTDPVLFEDQKEWS